MATMTSTPRLSCSIWRSMRRTAVDGDDAAVDGRGRAGASTSATWHGELTGGHEHEGAGPLRLAAWACCRTGMPKARVLPEPVLALPHTSRPARRVGDGERLDGEGRG